jgi:hypothetical protein
MCTYYITALLFALLHVREFEKNESISSTAILSPGFTFLLLLTIE